MTGIFDFVIVGGGSAGSILAGRLAETPGISICVLEAGRSDNTPLVQIPAGFLKVADAMLAQGLV